MMSKTIKSDKLENTPSNTVTTFSQNGHKRAVLYARTSGDDSKKDGRNLKSQLDMCREYSTAPERNYRIVAEMPEDDKGASGASFELPQLSAILAMAERHEFDVLVVRELDRLSRNLAKQLIVEESLKRNGVTLEYVLADYADSPEGNLQKHIKATIAEYEREKIKERMTRGKRNVVKGGRIMLHGDRPPYGYRSVIEKRDGKDVVTGLEVCDSEARIVRMIFDWYTTGDENGGLLSAGKIAKRLTEMHVPTWVDNRPTLGKKKRGRGEWSGKAVHNILCSKTYIGEWHYGKRNVKARNAQDTWILLAVPAIISREQWEIAQKQAQRNYSESKRSVKHDYLMRCKLRCSCNYAVGGHSVHNNGRVYLYYVCASYLPDVARAKCGLPNFRADQVDALVWDWLSDWFKDPADLRRKLEAYQAEQDKINAPILALLKTNDDLIAENQAQLARVKQMCEAEIYTIEESIERNHRLTETITGLESGRGELQKQLASNLSNEDIESLIEFAYLMADGVAEASESFEKRRQIIDLLDVRGILKVENDERVCYPLFILSREVTTRLVLPKHGKQVLPVALTNSYTGAGNQQIVISARLVLPNTRKRKPQVDIGALFAKVGATAEVVA